MIKITTFLVTIILRGVITAIIYTPVGAGCIFLSLIMWDDWYMIKASDILDKIWGKEIK